MLLGICLSVSSFSAPGQLLVRLDGPSSVYKIFPVNGEIWLAAQGGAFRVDSQTKQAVRVGGDTGIVNSIVPGNGEIWLATFGGAFRVDSQTKQVVPVGGIKGIVNSIVPVNGEIWLAADGGAFRMDSQTKQAVRVGGNTGAVNSIVPGNGEIWLAADRGAFRVDSQTKQAVRVGGKTGRVYSIVPGNGEIWLVAQGVAFRVDSQTKQAVRVGGNTGDVYSIVPGNGEIWLAADGGAFRVDSQTKQAVRVGGNTGSMNSIVPGNGEIWLAAQGGAFRVDSQTKQAVPVGRNTGHVYSIVPVNGELWLAAEHGAFRVDLGRKIRIDLDGALPLAAWLFGDPVWLEGDTHPIVRYVDKETGRRDMPDTHQSLPITVLFDQNRHRLLEKTKDGNNWKTITKDEPIVNIPLKPGWRTLYFAVRDNWGNEVGIVDPLEVKGWVMPTWSLSFLIPLLAVVFCVVCLALAPYLRYCHMMLMNPFLRNWVSFGTVPLLLTAVPSLRRHLFRRYRRRLAAESSFQTMAFRYVIPEERFTSVAFAATLAQFRVVGLHGQSGIGKSAFLTYLAYQSASRRSPHPLLRRLIPVFIDLSIAAGQEPKVMVRSQLQKYGDLTDEKLIDVLLDDGEFLFLFDGLNEVGEASQRAIIQFIDLHRNHSFACLSTQVATEEFRRVSALFAASPLSDEKVNDLIRAGSIDLQTKKKNYDPETLLSQFTPALYSICHNPFQLELVVEMWRTSTEIPKDLDEVYSRALGSLIDKEAWNATGNGDYPDILCALAFKMLTEKRPYDPKTDRLPAEVRAELDARKLLVGRGEVLEFRHDRIRAYLAARHFALRWRAILTADSTAIDPNWDAMLEFHVSAEADAQNVRELMFPLLKKDLDSAVRLNRWGMKNRPDLFAAWQEEFSKEVGKRVLGD
jgi:ligand-binding sensor domain-containing protein